MSSAFRAMLYFSGVADTIPIAVAPSEVLKSEQKSAENAPRCCSEVVRSESDLTGRQPFDRGEP